MNEVRVSEQLIIDVLDAIKRVNIRILDRDYDKELDTLVRAGIILQQNYLPIEESTWD